MLKTCPSDSELSRFAVGQLGDDELAAIGEHLDSCAHCRALVDAIPDPFASNSLTGPSGTSTITVGANVNNLLVPGTPGQSFSGRVRAVNAAGASAFSNTASAAVLGPIAPTPPAASAAPVITGASIFLGQLILSDSRLPGGSAVVALPPGTSAIFADTTGDGNGDLVLFSTLTVQAFEFDGVTGNLNRVLLDVNGDGAGDLLTFNPTTIKDGRTGVVVTA